VAAALGDRIVEVATSLFLAEGYEATSIEQVARSAGISKRTFYSRFADKAALFQSVVLHVIDRLKPADVDSLFGPGPLELVLPPLARAILRAALDPLALALHRMMLAEGGRFPDVAAIVARQGGSREAVDRIATRLAGPGLSRRQAEFAAVQFLQMVIAVPQRRAMGLGTPMSEAELDAWAISTVALFLNGWQGLSSGG
jgi:AcrR family transcriptional regulator